MRDWCNGAGRRLLATVEGVCSGSDPDNPAFDRAVSSALRHNVTILTCSLDRLLRNAAWRPWRRVQPVRQDFARLVTATTAPTARVLLLTIIDPVADPEVAHGQHVRRGQQLSGRPRGRPRAERPSERRARCLRQVLDLHGRGTSYPTIERITGVPIGTVHRWVGKSGAGRQEVGQPG